MQPLQDWIPLSPCALASRGKRCLVVQARAGQGLLYYLATSLWPRNQCLVDTAHLGLPGMCLLLKLLDGAGLLLCPWQTSTGAFRLILRCRSLLQCVRFSHCWKDCNLSHGLSPMDVTQPCLEHPHLGQPHHPWYWHCRSLSKEHLMPTGEA